MHTEVPGNARRPGSGLRARRSHGLAMPASSVCRCRDIRQETQSAESVASIKDTGLGKGRKTLRHKAVDITGWGLSGSHANSCLSKAGRAGTASLVQRLWVLGPALRGCSGGVGHSLWNHGSSPTRKHPTQECEPQEARGLCIVCKSLHIQRVWALPGQNRKSQANVLLGSFPHKKC